MTCTGITCNQGRQPCRDGCHKPRHSCAELGVCQGRNPPCSTNCLPILRTENSDDSSPHGEPWDWVDDLLIGTRWALAGAAIAAIVVLLVARAAGAI